MNPDDPLCFQCEGPVEVIDRDDTHRTVYCPTCDEMYGVEVGISENGNPVYWPTFRVALNGGNKP